MKKVNSMVARLEFGLKCKFCSLNITKMAQHMVSHLLLKKKNSKLLILRVEKGNMEPLITGNSNNLYLKTAALNIGQSNDCDFK